MRAQAGVHAIRLAPQEALELHEPRVLALPHGDHMLRAMQNDFRRPEIVPDKQPTWNGRKVRFVRPLCRCLRIQPSGFYTWL